MDSISSLTYYNCPLYALIGRREALGVHGTVIAGQTTVAVLYQIILYDMYLLYCAYLN